MKITLNFQPMEFPGPSMSVRAMLEAMRYSFPMIIVKVNGLLVERADYGSAMVADGDEVDMYHLVSGG